MARRTAKFDKKNVDIEKLEALLKQQCETIFVDIEEIRTNPHNKNKMGSQYFAALKAQMADPNIGFSQPIMVRLNPDPDGPKYMIIDGEHRYKAAKDIGYTKVPVQNFGAISETKLKFLMITQNQIRGSTSDDDIKKVLMEIEEELENDEAMKEIDVWARAITDEPIDESSKYGLDEEEYNEIMEEEKSYTNQVSLFLNPVQHEKYRRLVGQIRLTDGCTAEQAVMQIFDHFEETTGFGDATGDEILDEKQKDLIE